MSKLHRIQIFLLALAVSALGVLTPRAQAQHTDAVYNGWLSAYKVTDGSNFYLAKSFDDRSAGFWSQGYLVFEAEDAYLQSRKASRYADIVHLLDDFLARNGTDWTTGDTWNDDVEWIIYAFIRGYEITGNTGYLNAAATNWNTVFSRGWDNTYNGGIWENGGTDKTSKCTLSNAPFIFEGVELYRATGTSTYLTESQQVYAWQRQYLFNPTNSNTVVGVPGQVGQCAATPFQYSDNVYNSGLMVEAANSLYRVTLTASYLADAKLAASHALSKWPIVNVDYPSNGWFSADHLFRGLNQLANQNDLWSSYQTWLQNNANASWNVRRTDYNFSHNDFTTATPTTNLYAMEVAGSVDVQAALPLAQTFSGNYEIQNVNSGLALEVTGGSTSNGAAVAQNTYTGATSQLWTLVATTGGYYQIKNVKSGLVMNVKGHSFAQGALIQQYSAQGPQPGNDRWLPAWNVADSTWSFYNLNSDKALDVPSGSKGTGVQLDQWFTNNATNQKFNLISR